MKSPSRKTNRRATPSVSAGDRWRNIILAGFMGSGKTTVGRILAGRLGWTLLDTDRMIEERAGRSIEQIFAEEGEARFREMECEVARSLDRLEKRVIATGGGFVVPAENLKAALAAGRVVLLMASPEEIWHRVGRSRHRPLLRDPDPERRLRELLADRAEAYEAIALKVQTGGKGPEAVADEVLALLRAT